MRQPAMSDEGLRGGIARAIASFIRVVQQVTGLGLVARLADSTAAKNKVDWNWLAPMALLASMATVSLAFAGNANREGYEWAVAWYWLTLASVYFAFALRICWPETSRSEQLGLIGLLAFSTYLAKVMVSPGGFVTFDEFIHWNTATNIIEQERLFTPNALLPISPLYPGLEIVTTAIAQVSGLSVFSSATLLMGIVRLVCLGTLFAVYERLTASPRIASVACLVYMGHSNFYEFHAGFAYESLSTLFLSLLFLVLVAKDAGPSARVIGPALFLAAMFAGALAVTHHLTSYFAALLLLGYASIEIIRSSAPSEKWRALALAAIVTAAAYIGFRFLGPLTKSYIGPEVEGSFDGIWRVFKGGGARRELFVSESGTQLPLFMRAAGIGSAIVICAALAGGFFRSLQIAGLDLLSGWRRLFYWDKSFLVLLTLLTLLFPVALLLRLSPSSWEIGNRLGANLFLGVAIVAAVVIEVQWIGARPSLQRMAAVSALLTTIFLGGIVAGGATSALPGRYKAGTDALSVEPMAIETAKWTRERFGPNHRIAADRTNRLLMTVYGRQMIATTIRDGVDTSPLLLGDTISEYERGLIRRAKLDLVLVDMRLSQGRPDVGVYCEKGEPNEVHEKPPAPAALLKFNREAAVSRPFDNGTLKIFDVRALRE